MADIAIFRINYKSDFILTLQSDAGWTTPFCVKFWTGAPSKAYYAYYDGMSYTHCAPVDGEPTKLLVQFDDHHLPIGDLKFQIGYHFTVADFSTSVEDEVINQASVIIEVDDAPAQVMLDFNGETAPEIEFSLPAYANEAQRIANEQARIVAEEQRIANEQARISAEETRQANEQQRINAEAERVSDFASLKTESEAATAAANIAATLANEKAQLADDKAALAQAAATLANAKAQLAADKAALAQAAATLANEKAALAQQKAEYAQEQGDAAKTEAEAAHALNEEVRDDEEARDQAEQIRQQQETARQQAESQRVTDFNAQMQQQQTAYTNAEAARDTAFDDAETERDAKVDAKVADITNLQAQIGYFVCDTAAATAAKTIAATGYALTTGGNIRIKMTNANTADAVTLNINSTGAKALFYKGTQASSTNSWEAGEVIKVYYDGTNYQGEGNLSIIHEIDATAEYTNKDIASAGAVQAVMVEGTARTITNFDDWEDGCYNDRGIKVGVGLYKSSIIKLLKGQTITTLTQGTTYIAELDFTRLATHTGWKQSATEYTNISNRNKLIRVVVSITAGGGAATVPSIVTLSDVGKDIEKKSNVVGWGKGEEWEDTVSALDLKDTVITTEKDAFCKSGSINTEGGLNQAYGSLYIFENTGYRYMYVYNLAGTNRYYRSCALYSGEPSVDTCIKLFTFPPSGILKTEIPSNCRYIYVSAYQGTDASIYNRQTKILLFKDGSLLPFKYLLENFQLVKDTTIFDATSDLPALYDKYGRYIDIRNNFAYPGASTSNFRFIFCSDVHKNTDAFERIINITNRWAADGCVDALINTGDVAYDRPDESFDWYNQMRIQANVDVLTVPGNHDWNYYIGGNKERTYNNIIAPMVSGAEGTVEGIVQPSDASEGFRFYYYKDYKTVRFIAIYASVDSTEQLAWLVSVLEDARINNKHVIIGNHQSFARELANMKYATPDAWYNNVPNTFFSGFGSIQSSSASAGGGDITASYCQAVKDFMDAGGVFVCWISGHHHIDHFYDLNDTNTYGHQLMLNTGCVRQDELDGDSVRKGSIGNKDLYNFVSVSTDMKMLKVLRIGSNTDYLGRSKIVFTYNYGIHKIIANY